MRLGTTLVAAAAAAFMAACSSQPASSETSAERSAREASYRREQVAQLEAAATSAIARCKETIPGTAAYFESCAGYAVFPEIAKAGFGVGGAHGKGLVYEKQPSPPDRVIGVTEMTQGSIGLQIGGQTFSEIIFFEDEAALEHFKRGNAEISAAASGVAGGEGGGVAAKYRDGVAVFVFGEQGLMGEASIGGQGFSFEPVR